MVLATALVVLALLLTALVWVVVTGNLACAVLVLLLSAAWVLVNKPIEGAVLVPITQENGITSSDVLSVVALGITFLAVSMHRSRGADRRGEGGRRHRSGP